MAMQAWCWNSYFDYFWFLAAYDIHFPASESLMITPLLRQTSHCSIVSLIPPLLPLLNCKNYSRWIYPHFDHQLSWHSPRLLYQICHGLSPIFRWSTVYSVCGFFCLHEITCSSLCIWWHLRYSRKKCTLSYQSPWFTQLKYIKMPNCSCLITFYGMFYGTFNFQCYFPNIHMSPVFAEIKATICSCHPHPPTCTPLIELSNAQSPSRRPQPPRPPSRRPRGGANALGSDGSEHVNHWVSNGSCFENWLRCWFPSATDFKSIDWWLMFNMKMATWVPGWSESKWIVATQACGC